MKVLVAYDGSECADAALADLRRAGLPADVQCRVLSVIEHWLPPPSGLEIVEHLDRNQAHLALARRAASHVHNLRPGWDVSTQISDGSPATAILAIADEWQPDLIVVGAHGRTALGRLFFGSVSQKVLHEAHCTVRVARGHDGDPDRPVRLVLGFDGSDSAEAAVRAVAARSWPARSEARVLYATWPETTPAAEYLVGAVGEWITQEQARIEYAVRAAVAELSAAGLKAEALIKEEGPNQFLTLEAEEWGADCIFVGARGMSKLERLRLGSVSSAVAARAHCSVEVVREF